MESDKLTPKDFELPVDAIKTKLYKLGINEIQELTNISLQKYMDEENAWILKGERNMKIYAWYFEYNAKKDNWRIDDFRKHNSYQTNALSTFNTNAQNPEFKWLYSEICSSWRQLVDVRFKLLGLLPIASILIIKEILESDLSKWPLIMFSIAGLIFTYAIRMYDKRNTELHNQLISRGRKMEEESKIDNGHFMGRKKARSFNFFDVNLWINKIQHDRALQIIYGTTYIGWIAVIIYIFMR